MVQDLTQDNLEEIVTQNDIVFVQYGAGWCGNCRIMKPKFKKLATENLGVTFVYVDAEKLPESRKMATVNNLPTFAAFKNGAFVKQIQTNQADSLINFFTENLN